MKRKLAAVLAAILVVGSTTTFLAAPSVTTPSIDAGDLSNAAGEVTAIEKMTDAQLAEVIEEVTIAKEKISAGEATVAVQAVTKEVLKEAAAEAIKAVEAKLGVDVTEKVEEGEQKVTAALLAVIDLTVTGFTGSVDVTFSIDGVKAGNTVYILHEKADGTWETIAPKSVEDGKVVATLSDFSNYAIVKVAATSEKTGVAVSLLPLVATICAAGTVVCGKKVKFNA